MSNSFDRQEVVETAWEFLWVDGERPPTPVPAEEAAIHLEASRIEWNATPVADEVVHYLDDEEPEVQDVSVTERRAEITEPCDDVLARQHYIERPEV